MPIKNILLSAKHIAAEKGRFEPQRQNHGYLFIQGLEEYGDIASTLGASVLTLAHAQIQTPKRRNDPIEIEYGSQTRKVPGPSKFDEIEVTFNDYCDVNVLTILEAWHNHVADPVTGRTGHSNVIKKTAYFAAVSPDGTTARVKRINGIWPISVDSGDYDHSGTDRVQINVTFSVDSAEPVNSGFTLNGVEIDWGGTLATVNQVSGAFNAVRDIFSR